MSIGLATPIQDIHLQKEAAVSQGTLIMVMPMSKLHIDLDQLKIEGTS